MAFRAKHRHAALLRRVAQGRMIASDHEDWTPHVPKTKRVVAKGIPNAAYRKTQGWVDLGYVESFE